MAFSENQLKYLREQVGIRVLFLTELHKNESCNIYFLSKRLQVTYPHSLKITKELEEEGLVQREFKGRSWSLTIALKAKNAVAKLASFVNFLVENQRMPRANPEKAKALAEEVIQK